MIEEKEEKEEKESKPKTWYKRKEIWGYVIGLTSGAIIALTSPHTVAYLLAQYVGLPLATLLGYRGIQLGLKANNLKVTKENYKF